MDKEKLQKLNDLSRDISELEEYINQLKARENSELVGHKCWLAVREKSTKSIIYGERDSVLVTSLFKLNEQRAKIVSVITENYVNSIVRIYEEQLAEMKEEFKKL